MIFQGYKQKKDYREMKYFVLEQMASFKVHKLSSVLCTPEMCLFFFPAVAFGLIKEIVSVDKTSLPEKFVSF